MIAPLDFEKSINVLENKLVELQHLADTGDVNISSEIQDLQKKIEQQLQSTYAKLTPWQKVQVARHTYRPCFTEYVEGLIEDFTELCGDRSFADDQAIIGGIGRFNGRSVLIVGHQKGRDTEARLKHNFGMPRPEGYRKAKRLFHFADQFDLPVITLVDTAGAHPGVNAEERGQSEAIASSIEAMADLKVPAIATITGEGGSGGAIALAVGNAVNILEHSIYSVISPEGCASILWRTADKREEAAEALKLTAQDLLKLGVVDKIIDEPLGGAHRHMQETVQRVGQAIQASLDQFIGLDADQLIRQRKDKFIQIGRSGLSL